MKEGKKGEYNLYNNAPINNSKTNCDKCNGELIKLETTLGKTRIKEEAVYKDLFWVCICIDCGRYVKVFEYETKICNYKVGKNSRYKDRGATSGR